MHKIEAYRYSTHQTYSTTLHAHAYTVLAPPTTVPTHLDGVGITGLSQDLEQGWVRDEEESWEDQPLLLQVSSEGLLTELKLLQEVGQELAQRLITDAALHHVGHLMGTGHDLLPGLVNASKSLGFLQRETHNAILTHARTHTHTHTHNMRACV